MLGFLLWDLLSGAALGLCLYSHFLKTLKLSIHTSINTTYKKMTKNKEYFLISFWSFDPQVCILVLITISAKKSESFTGSSSHFCS